MMIANAHEILMHAAARFPVSAARRLAFTALVAVLVLPGCDSGAPREQASEPPAVGVIEVAEQKVNPYFEFVAKTRAKESVALRARVTGFLESRDFQEGGDVEAGQVLFKIEPERYQAALAQAEAELAAAEASLNRAKVDAARYEELAKAKNVSQQKVDEAEAEVLVQEAAVQTAKATIKQAQLDVDYTQVTAPIAGRIDVASYTVGNLLGPDSGVLATINMMDPINVVFSISETWYLELVAGGSGDQESGWGRRGVQPRTADSSAGRFDVRVPGQVRLHRQQGRREDRHRAGAGPVPEPGPVAAAGAVRDRGHRAYGGKGRGGDPAGGGAHRPGRSLRAVRSMMRTR